MIHVTVWTEHVQERWATLADDAPEAERAHMRQVAAEMAKMHPNGLHETLRALFAEEADFEVRTATLDMPDNGLPDAVLNDTDVLVWWGHVAHDQVPDALAVRVRDRVLKGMGFLALHSAHASKPMVALLGTSASLRWREDDRAHVWIVAPQHPVVAGVPMDFELSAEEMYGEYFDIPTPDELVTISSFSGGEVFRSGCAWRRGYGRVFYFQPGHETNPSFYHPYVRRILQNAVRWAAPTRTRDTLTSPHAPKTDNPA